MPGPTAKRLTMDFSANVEKFNNILLQLQDQESVSESDLARLKEAQKNIATSARTYFNDLDVSPEVLRLTAPLMNGELNNASNKDFAKKAKQFEANFNKVVTDFNKAVTQGNEEQVLEEFCGIKDIAHIQATADKLSKIQKDLSEKLKQIKS